MTNLQLILAEVDRLQAGVGTIEDVLAADLVATNHLTDQFLALTEAVDAFRAAAVTFAYLRGDLIRRDLLQGGSR